MILANISKTYHNKDGTKVLALKNINLNFDGCGLVVISGSSGSGKTTLLNILALQDDHFEGEITDRPSFDYVNQDFRLFESFSVYDNLRLVSDDPKKIDAYLNDFKLAEFRNKKTKKLSNGQKRRVQLIRSLLMEKDMLLCDEPTAALDPDLAKEAMDKLKDYSKDHLVIVVTHDIAISEEYADRLINIEEGQIVLDEMINHNKKLSLKEADVTKHSLKTNWLLALKYLRSRLGEVSFFLIFVTIALLLSFISYSIFSNISLQTNERVTFRNNENLIISLPKTDKINAAGKMVYINYDRYSKSQVETLVDNIDDIIAVQMYNSCDGTYIARNTLSAQERGMSEEEFQEMLNYEFSYREEAFSETDTYPIHINGEVEYITSPDPIDSLPFFYEDGYSTYSSDYLRNNAVEFYDLVNDYEPELLYGEMPQDSSEIIISYNFANYLLNYYYLDDLSELIDQKIRFGLYTESQASKNDIDLKPHEFYLTISAISNLENDDWLCFFNSGLLNNDFMQRVIKNPDRFEAETLKIYIDPVANTDDVVDRINEIITPHNSYFVKYSLVNGPSSSYRSLSTLLLYLIILDIVFAFVYLIYNIAKIKRNIKENQLWKTYGYNYRLINFFKMIMPLLCGIIIFSVVIYILGPYINEWAIYYKVSSFITFDFPSVVFVTLLFTFFIFAVNLLTRG